MEFRGLLRRIVQFFRVLLPDERKLFSVLESRIKLFSGNDRRRPKSDAVQLDRPQIFKRALLHSNHIIGTAWYEMSLPSNRSNLHVL